jgi:hypothetical protein
MKKRILSIITAAVCVICTAGCANGQKESATGTLALATTTTAATTEAPAADTTEAPADTTAADTAAADTTEASEKDTAPAAPVGDSIKDKCAFVYRGVTFNIGDKADDVIPKLGDQSKPSYKAQPCIPGAGEIEHFTYDGIYLAVTQFGLICDIGFTTVENPGTDAATVTGLNTESTAEDYKAVLGEPADDYGFMYIYRDGSFSFSVSFDEDTGKTFSLSSEDMDLPL